jgi:CelD/BcsL family acetyltransferase involved in cellulose biosynthesis
LLVLRSEWLDPAADPRWSRFIARNPEASIFHHPAWLGLLRAQYGYALSACCVLDGNGAILAGLPIARVKSRITGDRLVALPFSDFCPALVDPTGGVDASPALARALEEEHTRTGLDLRVHAALAGLSSAFVVRRFYHHRLRLQPDFGLVERGYLKSQIRRGVAKARREGLQTTSETGLAALDAFYALHMQTRRRLGVPTQPKRFVRRFRDLFAAGLGFVMLVWHGERPIAAAVFLSFKRVLTYKYGASDARFLNTRPNNLLFSDAIAWGCANGMQTLDLGRTDLNNPGLRSFKRAWGAEERDLAYTYLARAAPVERASTAARAGKRVIRASPALVSRLLGEALYRHAG